MTAHVAFFSFEIAPIVPSTSFRVPDGALGCDVDGCLYSTPAVLKRGLVKLTFIRQHSLEILSVCWGDIQMLQSPYNVENVGEVEQTPIYISERVRFANPLAVLISRWNDNWDFFE